MEAGWEDRLSVDAYFLSQIAVSLGFSGNVKAKYCYCFLNSPAPNHGGKERREIPGEEIQVTLIQLCPWCLSKCRRLKYAPHHIVPWFSL